MGTGVRELMGTAMAQQSDWFKDSETHAAAGDLQGAERAILGGVQHQGVYASLAMLWERQLVRRLAAGDDAGAEAAYHRGAYWAFLYASGATSGGEGMALSMQRDQMIRALRRRLGYDPGPDPGFQKAQAALPDAPTT